MSAVVASLFTLMAGSAVAAPHASFAAGIGGGQLLGIPAGFVEARANVGLRPGPRLTVLGMGGYGAVPNVCCGVPDAVTVANAVEVDVELRAAWDFVRAPGRSIGPELHYGRFFTRRIPEIPGSPAWDTMPYRGVGLALSREVARGRHDVSFGLDIACNDYECNGLPSGVWRYVLSWGLYGALESGAERMGVSVGWEGSRPPVAAGARCDLHAPG